MSLAAIFDIGKTNKKLFLFDEGYNIVFEKCEQITETTDEDGESCENLESLKDFVFNSIREILHRKNPDLKAINFATYGASFVYIDDKGNAIAPLYNYLKTYPGSLKKKFYDTYGGEASFSFQTASPVLGSLNSGMQLYRMKYEKPDLFKKIKYALHLPQYMSFLLTGKPCADITSIGCHTNLWNFANHDYHPWVKAEGIDTKLPPIVPCDEVYNTTIEGAAYSTGAGLHDSSAALIPYLVNFREPFVLISTGTWCISLHPFNREPLTEEELDCDCLCYLQYNSQPVKASRLFAGYIHDRQVERLASFFNKHPDHFKSIPFINGMAPGIQNPAYAEGMKMNKENIRGSVFEKRDLNAFTSAEEAYHQLMYDLVTQQHISTQLVLKGQQVKRIFVDGGFSKNSLYMNLLASFFPAMEVYAASIAQSTAIGAALAIRDVWNKTPLPKEMIKLKYFAPAREHQL